MAPTGTPASALAVPNEKFLTLKDGRKLAYAIGGDLSSKKVAVMLHGVFGVGVVEQHTSKQFEKWGWVNLAPSVPGWGLSSPWPSDRPVSAFAADIQELLQHTVGQATHILVFGGSYGSIWAYGAAANCPPAGMARIEPPSAIRGLCILGGFSPYSDDDGYAAACNGMTTMNWLTVGRPGKNPLLSWIHPMVGRVIQGKLTKEGLEGGLGIIRSILTGPSAMKPEERAEIEAWAASVGTDFATWEGGMARNSVLSVRDTLEGYYITPKIINGYYGFDLKDIVIPHAGASSKPALPITRAADVPSELPPVVVGGALRDHLAPIAMQRWVAARIPGAQMIELQGNHIAAITTLLPMLHAMINGIEARDRDAKA